VTRSLLATVAVCLVACSAAAAHGGGGAGSGYRSTVTHITPAGMGVRATVVEGDDQIKLRNAGRRRIVVFGYDGEPYLLFEGGRVFRNSRSPATYLNQDRYADVKVPKTADAEAAPRWVALSTAPTYQWHDHRIHWMSPIAPPVVRQAKGAPHHIFDWRVRGMVDGKPLLIAGSLDWVPVHDDGFPVWAAVVAAVGAVLLVAGGFWWLRRRRRKEGLGAASA
jgi:LPXTG-motif cell wall-anchored protein